MSHYFYNSYKKEIKLYYTFQNGEKKKIQRKINNYIKNEVRHMETEKKTVYWEIIRKSQMFNGEKTTILGSNAL
jgi:hypothetical protein